MIDHFATRDALDRKVPRTIGFLTVLRGMPWLKQMFTGEVPSEMVAIDDTDAVVPCPCKAVTVVPNDVAKQCSGECGRWFWNFYGRVLVGYEPNIAPTPEETPQS